MRSSTLTQCRHRVTPELQSTSVLESSREFFFWFCLNHLIATPRQGLSKRTPLFASARGRPNVPQQEGCAQRTQKIATGRHGFFSRPSRKTMGSRFSYVSPPSSQRQYPQQEVVTWRRKAPCTDWLR